MRFTDPSGHLVGLVAGLIAKYGFGAKLAGVAWSVGIATTIDVYRRGGSFGDALKSGAIAGVSAWAFGSIGEGVNWSELGPGKLASYGLRFGLVGGISKVLQGGKFGHGFVSAGVNPFVANALQGGLGDALGGPGIVAAQIVVGGTVSELTGGKFANGAAYAAFSIGLDYAGQRFANRHRAPIANLVVDDPDSPDWMPRQDLVVNTEAALEREFSVPDETPLRLLAEREPYVYDASAATASNAFFDFETDLGGYRVGGLNQADYRQSLTVGTAIALGVPAVVALIGTSPAWAPPAAVHTRNVLLPIALSANITATAGVQVLHNVQAHFVRFVWNNSVNIRVMPSGYRPIIPRTPTPNRLKPTVVPK